MAKIIASKLLNNLSGKDIDAPLRTISVRPYVFFILVPECITLLIIEAIKVSEEEARTIMAESSQAGILIYPEDEAVVRQDEED